MTGTAASGRRRGCTGLPRFDRQIGLGLPLPCRQPAQMGFDPVQGVQEWAGLAGLGFVPVHVGFVPLAPVTLDCNAAPDADRPVPADHLQDKAVDASGLGKYPGVTQFSERAVGSEDAGLGHLFSITK